MNDKNKVFIFDTTMRDGEQSPGASMSLEEKIGQMIQPDLRYLHDSDMPRNWFIRQMLAMSET